MIDSELARLHHAAKHHVQNYQGYPIAWKEWGAGPTLMLIHGGHGSWMHWARNIDDLAENFRVLIPDLPGFGESADFDCPPHDASRLPLLLDCLEHGVAQLVGDAPMYLTGFSFGGAIAGSLAPRLRQLERLALLGSGGHGTPRRQTEPLVNWREFQGLERKAALRQNLLATMLSSEHAADDLAVDIHAYSCEKTRFRSKAISRRPMLPEILKALNKPVLMVWGDADVTAVPKQAAELLAQGDPQKILRLLPDAGHWVQFEKPKEINQLLKAWFLNHQPCHC
jgi:pimeloyl-ACP methyl ester carboxylesterase